MNGLNALVMDPNIVYVVLVVGLWATVTAAYIPGTGIVEGIAAIAVIAAMVALIGLPTQWIAAILLMVGVLSFLLIPFLNQRWARLAEGGLVLQVIGSLFLFNGLQVSWLLIGFMIVVSIAYHRLALLPLLEKTRNQSAVIDDNGQLIGSTGRVVKPSEKIGANHVGSVNINGEQWTAYSDHPLRVGEQVMVIEREGLQLYVEGVKHKQAPQN